MPTPAQPVKGNLLYFSIFVILGNNPKKSERGAGQLYLAKYRKVKGNQSVLLGFSPKNGTKDPMTKEP